MKETTSNKYKSAGIWNIVCGVIYTLAYVSIFVLIGIEILGILGEGGISHPVDFITIFLVGLGVFFVTGVGALLWAYVMWVPAFMFITAGEMLSKRKKGAGVKLWIIFNILMKIISICVSVYLGVQVAMLINTFSSMWIFVILIATAVFLLISSVMDCRALFKRENKEMEKIK